MTRSALAERIFERLITSHGDYESIDAAFAESMASKALLAAETFAKVCDERAKKLPKQEVEK